MATETITLEVHHCAHRLSYLAHFEGPAAEDMALAFVAARRSTHAIGEPVDYDELPDDRRFLDGKRYPRLYDLLHPTCEHGMSAQLCYGRAHYVRDEELAMGW